MTKGEFFDVCARTLTAYPTTPLRVMIRQVGSRSMVTLMREGDPFFYYPLYSPRSGSLFRCEQWVPKWQRWLAEFNYNVHGTQIWPEQPEIIQVTAPTPMPVLPAIPSYMDSVVLRSLDWSSYPPEPHQDPRWDAKLNNKLVIVLRKKPLHWEGVFVPIRCGQTALVVEVMASQALSLSQAQAEMERILRRELLQYFRIAPPPHKHLDTPTKPTLRDLDIPDSHPK